MSQHTPGPWIVNGPHDAPWVCTADHRTILPETMTDARLIAAAPELLAALQAIVTGNVYGNPTQWNLCIDRGIAAIAKVTNNL